jgi:hypothetical protein
MKRVKTTFFVGDNYTANDFKYANKGVIEMETYEEQKVSKDKSLEDEYTFERLTESMWEFANGIWKMLKGFWGMLSWSAVIIFEGFKWVWSRGVDKKKENVVGGKVNGKISK